MVSWWYFFQSLSWFIHSLSLLCIFFRFFNYYLKHKLTTRQTSLIPRMGGENIWPTLSWFLNRSSFHQFEWWRIYQTKFQQGHPLTKRTGFFALHLAPAHCSLEFTSLSHLFCITNRILFFKLTAIALPLLHSSLLVFKIIYSKYWK